MTDSLEDRIATLAAEINAGRETRQRRSEAVEALQALIKDPNLPAGFIAAHQKRRDNKKEN